jgi:hypothetical protein
MAEARSFATPACCRLGLSRMESLVFQLSHSGAAVRHRCESSWDVPRGSAPVNGSGISRADRTRTVVYWICTLFVAFENAAGAMWSFLPLVPRANHLHAAVVFSAYLHVTLAHLGYPQYFRFVLGPWQLACAAALLAPRFPRVKEWAYAGVFFNYTSAIVSRFFAGDGPDVAAIVIAVLAVMSWALRPPDRRLADSISVGKTNALAWIASAGALVLLLILSLFWLPKIPK